MDFRLNDGKIECLNTFCLPAFPDNPWRKWEPSDDLKTVDDIADMVREEWIDNCGIPSKFREASFENFERQRDPAAFEAVTAYAQWIYQRWDGEPEARPASLVLFSPGKYGCGKTHLAVSALRSYMDSSRAIFVRPDGHIRLVTCPVHFTALSGLLGRIRRTFGQVSRETEESIIQELIEIDVLVLDDIDKYLPSDKRFLQRILFEILNGRYEAFATAATILTSNLGLAELRTFIGGACASRLTEMCQFVECTGEDYRLVARARQRRGKTEMTLEKRQS